MGETERREFPCQGHLEVLAEIQESAMWREALTQEVKELKGLVLKLLRAICGSEDGTVDGLVARVKKLEEAEAKRAASEGKSKDTLVDLVLSAVKYIAAFLAGAFLLGKVGF